MINSHIHLDLDSVKSPSKTTTGVIVPSTGKENWDKVISYCNNDNYCHFALGIHPWFISDHQMFDLYSLEVRIEEENQLQ